LKEREMMLLVMMMMMMMSTTTFDRFIKPLTPNDLHISRTTPLNSKGCILYIYSTNIGTEYFKHALSSPFFFSSKCSLFHNANFFGSCIIHILYTRCADIKKEIIIRAPSVNLRLRIPAYATKSSLLEDSSDHLQCIPSKNQKEFTIDFALHRRKKIYRSKSYKKLSTRLIFVGK
jgi:hypothetical protein